MHGGWLERASTYRGLSLGLRYGQYLLEARFNVMSRKSVRMRFVSVVIFRPYLWKMLLIFLFSLSIAGPGRPRRISSTSSLYKPLSLMGIEH